MMTLETPIASKTLRFGHTPDPDDAFMFYGFSTNQVRIRNYQIQHVLEDIETLNQRALHGEIEVSAISASVYPHIVKHYWVLPMGASIGRNYGPVIVHKKGEKPTGKKIGIPGVHTTAYLLLRLYTEGFEPVTYRFDEIPDAIKRNEVDYGLLIHEAQITYESQGFEKLLDLGVEWKNETGHPIPLGLDVVRKDLGKELALDIASALRKSIEIAHQERGDAVSYAMKFGRGIQRDVTDQFVGMYVNQDTLDMGPEGEKALNLLYDKAYRAGVIKTPSIVDILRP